MSVSRVVLYTVFCVLASFPLVAQQNAVRVLIDLKHCTAAKVHVTVFAPSMNDEHTRYIIPKSVPGTYSQDNYGRFVDNAIAFDAEGKSLTVTRDSGDILVDGKLARLEYWVGDTWHDSRAADVFQPTGSNIQPDTNFVINTHAFVGYFDGYELLPYEVQVVKPEGFFGATSLDRLEINDTTDVLSARSYPHLVDNPIMYCIPDTVSFMEANMNVMIAVFSANHKVHADQILNDIRPLAGALGKFFGVLPVPRYTFIFYFADMSQMTNAHMMATGALEHSQSSFYFLMEGSLGFVSQSVRNTAGHEFLHILVPLNLHSEEVHSFDFRHPKMSQHLWLYEGCTEYFSLLSRVQDTLLTESEFFSDLRRKITTGLSMLRGKPFSLTNFSRNVLTPENQELYPIIYESGAALAFCLDVKIRELTNNSMDLLGMIRKLSESYGPERPFKDDELFDEMTRVVGPGIRPFIDDYIIGTKVVPYAEYFEKLGYSYRDSAQVSAYQFNAARVFFKRGVEDAVVLSTHSDNDFNIVDGDTLVKINDIHVTPDNKMEMLGMYIWSPHSDQSVTLTIHRNGQELSLSAKPREKLVMKHNILEELASPSPAQSNMKKTLLRRG